MPGQPQNPGGYPLSAVDALETTQPVDKFSYPLPDDRIAQRPVEPRSAARLLDATRSGGSEAIVHRHVADLPDLLGPGDLLVLNDTRVIPARLQLRKATGGAVEVFVVEIAEDRSGTALVRPGRRVVPGTVLLDGAQPVVEVGDPLAIRPTG